jgi:signal transduction histidine kinase
VLEDRRRIARDLHDGLAQELALVRRNLGRMDAADPVVERATRGAERALAEARRGIAVLAEESEQSLDAVVTRAAREVAEREGIAIVLSLAPCVHVAAEQREALVRIVAEAITNAARHGATDSVRVSLVAGSRVRVCVSDRGRGFEPADGQRRGRYGLISMRERARAVGGELRVASWPGEGTEVEVTL